MRSKNQEKRGIRWGTQQGSQSNSGSWWSVLNRANKASIISTWSTICGNQLHVYLFSVLSRYVTSAVIYHHLFLLSSLHSCFIVIHGWYHASQHSNICIHIYICPSALATSVVNLLLTTETCIVKVEHILSLRYFLFVRGSPANSMGKFQEMSSSIFNKFSSPYIVSRLIPLQD